MKRIYIVVSQTGTLLSRILKAIKQKEYNHVSIGFDVNLRSMYSFGRVNPYNPFVGGFVHESPYHGTFKRFKQTKAIVYELEIEDELYREMRRYIRYMRYHRKQYQYNYLGLFLAGINVLYQPEGHYYCSEFVRDFLVKYGILYKEQFPSITEPAYFIDIMQGQKCIYQGLLADYTGKYA